MKLAYVSIDVRGRTGIKKKIESQINTLNQLGISSIHLTLTKKTSRLYKMLRRISFNNYMFEWKVLDDYSEIDAYYFRYPLSDLSFIRTLKKLKKNNKEIKILIEIPTYPYDKEIIRNGKVYKIKDKFFRKFLYKYVDRIVTYSKDEEIFNIPTLKISNGVDTNKIKKRETIPHEEINLIAVAAFSTWHGYDRCIKGLANYYKNNPKTIVHLHLVGDGKVVDDYKILVNSFKLEEYVHFHGRKVEQELDEIYNLCDIGLDAMGRHRSNVYYNSSLKGKEYLAKGLPIVSGIETELDKSEDFSYYMRVSADDTSINIDDIIEFYQKIYPTTESHHLVANEIRQYAEMNYDMKVCMKPVVDFMTKIK